MRSTRYSHMLQWKIYAWFEDKVRNLAKSKNPDHPWLKMSDEEILKSAGLWEKDFSSGIQGYNLAGVLLFGKDDVIRSCCPGYITDAYIGLRI